GPRTVPGKDRFFVVDCVDNFGRHGLTLVGQEVARELGLSVAEDLPVVRPAARAAVQQRLEQRRRAALASAEAWLRLTGLEAEQYSYFGELGWERPDRSQRSAAVFVESVGAVEQAVTTVREAVTSGRWRGAEEQGVILDRMGAVRAVDWMDLVADCKLTRRPPVLLAVPDLAPDDEDREAADLIAAIVRAGLERGAAEAARRAAAFATAPRLRGRFPDPAAFEREVLRLLDQMMTQPPPARPAAAVAAVPATGSPSRAVPVALAPTVPAAAVAATVAPPAPAAAPTVLEPPPTVLEARAAAPAPATAPPALPWDDVQAVVDLGLAVAGADGQVDEAERRVLAQGAARVFEAPAAAAARVAELCRASAALTPGAAALRLVERLSWPKLLVVFDTLLHVAVADGRLDERERTVLGQVGAALGIPRDEHERRLTWYLNIDPARPVAVAPGVKACAVCHAGVAATARFCGECGAALGGAG
ncbi:MAG TPA: TerB family tellurite resistance protein, partial [Polyangia bacterium]